MPSGCIWEQPIWPATLEGVVIMTSTTADRIRGLINDEALVKAPDLCKEIEEAIQRGRQIAVSFNKIAVEPFEGLDEQGYPVWGAPVSWHLCQEIVGETDDPVEGRLVELGRPKYIKGPLCV